MYLLDVTLSLHDGSEGERVKDTKTNISLTDDAFLHNCQKYEIK